MANGLTQKGASLLLPFDDDEQLLLKQVDNACFIQGKLLKEEATRQKLAGKPLTVDMETLVWFKLIRAYGILFNRAVDAGWVTGVHLKEVEGR